eukprot:scaffold644644_cov51-Attheya_sp.AAC.1
MPNAVVSPIVTNCERQMTSKSIIIDGTFSMRFLIALSINLDLYGINDVIKLKRRLESRATLDYSIEIIT